MATYLVHTELGDVKVGLGELRPGGLRALTYEGPPDAARYVRTLVFNLTRLEGRLLGDACTPEELARALVTGPIAHLVELEAER